MKIPFGPLILCLVVMVVAIVAPVSVTKTNPVDQQIAMQNEGMQVTSVQSTMTTTTAPANYTITWTNAAAACDPSEGRHSGLAYVCFLQWLMDMFDASNSPY